jgi:cellobiose phosphorylase
MAKDNLIISIYRKPDVGKKILKTLAGKGFYPSTALCRYSGSNVKVIQGNVPLSASFGTYALGFFVFSLILSHFLWNLTWAVFLFEFIPALLLLGLLIKAYQNRFHVDQATINKFQKSLMQNECFVLVKTNGSSVEKIIDTMRGLGSDVSITFTFTRDYPDETKDDKFALPRKPIQLDSLEKHAIATSKKLKDVGFHLGNPHEFYRDLSQVEPTLNKILDDIKIIEQTENISQISGEWLLDNSQAILGYLNDIVRNFPRSYYAELPQMKTGPFSGQPRAYLVATEIVALTDGKVTREAIETYLDGIQKNCELTIGELWAVPLFIKYRLIEQIENLAFKVVDHLRESQEADYWANRIISSLKLEPAKLIAIIAELSQVHPRPSPYFATKLLDNLCDEETALNLIRSWVERIIGAPTPKIVLEEQQQQTREQTSLSNCITSLHQLSQISWREIFEEVCVVDRVLENERSGTFKHMDPETRDRYRQAIENLSKFSHTSESQVAKTAVELTHEGEIELAQHVGYYLIDNGRSALQERIGYHTPASKSIKKLFLGYPTFSYLSTLALLFALLSLLFYTAGIAATLSLPVKLAIFALALFPISEIALSITNYFVLHLLKPRMLSKMNFKEGIPDQWKTLVVVPIIFSNQDHLKNEIDKLEIRYLANNNKNLLFSIFSDFCDADESEIPEDKDLIQFAIDNINQLNVKYKTQSFFLFHRSRSWCQCEQKWIGWERKRGKLNLLNCYLTGQTDSFSEGILYCGDAAQLKNTRFVITLDADTQLPRNSALRMIETLAHPLNRPVLSENGDLVVRGYGIIQPRVSTELPSSRASLFARIFSDPSGVDPYTKAVSDIYQDLFGEGVYHGKGIYDIHCFQQVLWGRFPDERILSHDLLEGSFVRAGFASDIELYDTFPDNYFTFADREHRWIRGDWQIIDWISPWGANGKSVSNPLSLINRWKIFDNLRRSLIYPAIFALLVVSWLFASSPAPELIAALMIGLPLCFQLVEAILIYEFFKIDLWISLYKQATRFIASVALIPHQAYLCADAVIRACYRQIISRQHLLEWKTSSDSSLRSAASLWPVSAATAVIAITIALLKPLSLAWALPFLLLWLVVPFIVHRLNLPSLELLSAKLSTNERLFLRQVARLTWRYFDDFVTEKNNWLPPDNYQESLRVEIANRTSSTNIGLYLLSILSAKHLGYIQVEEAFNRLNHTFTTLKKLKKFEGHFLNWYNIETLETLKPEYVSTVDSGNLLGCMLTVEKALLNFEEEHYFNVTQLSGFYDEYGLLISHLKQISSRYPQLQTHLQALNAVIKSGISATDYFGLVNRMHHEIVQMGEETAKDGQFPAPATYWFAKIRTHLDKCIELYNRYTPWMSTLLYSAPNDQIKSVLSTEINQLFKNHQSFKSLSTIDHHGFKQLFTLIDSLSEQNRDPKIQEWLNHFKQQFFRGKEEIDKLLQQFAALQSDLEAQSKQMNMGFLYNQKLKLFSIGYNVTERKLDNSHYDLLASEARLASFIAIARGDVQTEHWWALGRPFGYTAGRWVLLSWGGTMFEYLMPLLFNKSYDQSMLEQACKDAVYCQIDYGKQRGIPWGISESAYSGLDWHKIYQYKAFGVPTLGLKRNLEDDLVVTPYSSALALIIAPHEAIQNLQRLKNEKMYGEYGFFEAIDYARTQSATGKRGVIIYAYMAHHQGMSLVSIDNTLNEHVMQNLFHSHPLVAASESLLFERITIPASSARAHGQQTPIQRLTPIVEKPVFGRINTPDTLSPVTQLLSNGHYSVMVTNSGGGYSRFDQYDITRWRSDIARDRWGSYVYIKDVDSHEVWSNTYQPTVVRPQTYWVNFSSGKAEFIRRDHGIECTTTVVVSSEDHAEIRTLTLANLTVYYRTLELTSYNELCLAPHRTDRMHPIFNKMFIETEAFPDQQGLLAFRRLRAPDDNPLWTIHTIAYNEDEATDFSFETSRALFIGRNGTLQTPEALHRKLSESSGYVLDPIFSIRKTITLEPGQRLTIAFTTATAGSRKEAFALMDKYSTLSAVARAQEMAWTHAELDLRYLYIQHDRAQLYQQLASSILYPQAQLRASVNRIRSNTLGQARLWAYGISGDLPIAIVTVGDQSELEIVQQMLTAQAFWIKNGLHCDLLILSEEASGYSQPLSEALHRMIQPFLPFVSHPGAISIRTIDQIPAEELNLLYAAADISIVAARGSIWQQLAQPDPSTRLLPPLRSNPRVHEEPSTPLTFMDLKFFNGMGGFTHDGKEYASFLTEPNQITPAPWINVLANSIFGSLPSESGMGMTWYLNSQSNRLSPWSNDPVIDPITDVIYVRDEDLNVFWTVTRSPIHELDPYRCRHGQGYTIYEHNSHAIEQTLTHFVPVSHEAPIPIRMSILKLRNTSSRKRQLTVTHYLDWVLGGNREETQKYIVSAWNELHAFLSARNAFNPEFGSKIAFTASLPAASSYTGDRVEFIGRNGSLERPAALKRVALSNTTGAALDPCSALQIEVELDPGQETELYFLLGVADNESSASTLIDQYLNPSTIEEQLEKTKQWWEETLTKIQIFTPDESANFLFNRWLVYQVLACRYWARSGFYQSSGAFGFRDQLQDVASLLYTHPELTREHILRAAARQFPEGDVQHWWHPRSGAGVRTRISDDLLWLPAITLYYLKVTGDHTILQETIPFLDGPLLKDHEHEIFIETKPSDQKATLLEHCKRAILKALQFGSHGIPLIGTGDWNDGMNLIGAKGKGESVWLGWFLALIIKEFVPVLRNAGEVPAADELAASRDTMLKQIEANAWNGEWYMRAFFDDGTPIGATDSPEAKIDSLPQSWAVISESALPERAEKAMDNVIKYLVKEKDKMVLLFTPPFENTSPSPGYIQGYPPGVRENGGQYTHAATWVIRALAMLRKGDLVWKILNMVNPINHSLNPEENQKYKVEPYAIAADIYDLPGREGMGGWTWYTGSAGVMYRDILEKMIGFDLRENTLRIDPVIPSAWDGFTLKYRHQTTHYEIKIENPQHVSSGVIKMEIDGQENPDKLIHLQNDNQLHQIRIVMGPLK